jgi:hypothetical protein
MEMKLGKVGQILFLSEVRKVMKQKVFIYILVLLLLASITNLTTGKRNKVLAAATGLVAAYGFEEGTGTTLSDASGNSNNGTLQNGPVWVTGGKFGKALQFDGINDLVSVPDANSLDLTGGMTLEAWVYPTGSMSGWDSILMKEYSTGLIYALYANGDSNVPYIFISNNSTEHGIGGTSSLPINKWTHVAATFDGSNLRLYINGTQVRVLAFSGNIQTSARGMYIGGSSVWSNEGFAGIIDEVRIYNRALSASEISTDMNTPVTGGTPGATATPTKTATPGTLSSPTPTRAVTTTPTPIFTATRTPTPISAPAITGPLRKSSTNPRYFAGPNGNIVYLTGSHTWCDFMDCDDTNPITATFDYPKFLNFLVAHNHNFFRLWRAENARGGETGANFWFSPMPYQRSTTCCAFDGGNKFDLNKFNQSYFDRLRQHVIDAGNKGIYVSIMLFDGWSIESKGSNHNPWAGHPYKLSNNINSINGDLNNDGQGGETHTLSSSQITALQEAYVRKVIDSVGDLDNVLYEISNEDTGSTANTNWQSHMINYIKSYEASKPKQHPVGMTVQYPNGSNQTLFNSPADWISPNGSLDTPPVASGSKVILSDTDHLCGICGNRQWVWKSFTRGENPLFMDPYDGAATGRGAPSGYDPNNANDVSLRDNLGYAALYARRMNLAAMTPQPSLCSTGFCLAKATSSSAEYIVYLPNGGSVNVNLSATTENMAVEWFKPSSGATFGGGSVSGGATKSFTAPFSGDAVLYLVRNNVEVFVGNVKQNDYYLAKQKVVIDSYPSLVDGPVKVVSVNSENIVTSQRVFYQDSFNELMGSPENQFTTEYWFPWYDNVSMSTWVLVGNPSSSQTAYVNIYIGGVKQGSTRSIPPGGNITPRFTGVMDGPVRVVSVTGSGTSTPLKLFASERTIYQNSFNEVMGYPANQLTTEYWFPYYDNVSMSTWVLVGNPSSSQTAYVNIYVGGVKQGGTLSIPPGGNITPRYTGVTNGPVRMVSVTGSGTSTPLQLFTSERAIYRSSFNEVMGYPANRLTTKYWFTWYDNVSMDTSLIIGKP